MHQRGGNRFPERERGDPARERPAPGILGAAGWNTYRSYAIGALVDIPAPGAEGVVFAHGSRFGGHALYIKDNRLHYVYNFVGSIEQKIVATTDVPVGEKLILSASFEKDGEAAPGVATGILSLTASRSCCPRYIAGASVGSARRTAPAPASSAR